MSKLIAGIFFNLVLIATACTTDLQKRASMDIQHTTLWQLIETLIEHPSFTLDTIGQVIPVEFTKRDDNGSFSFYEGGPFRLIDQVLLETVHLGIRHESGISKWVGLDLSPDSACVTLDDVYAHYPDIDIIGAPRGHSLDEMTAWGIQLPWGEMVFGFKELSPNCLSHVGIERNTTTTSP